MRWRELGESEESEGEGSAGKLGEGLRAGEREEREGEGELMPERWGRDRLPVDRETLMRLSEDLRRTCCARRLMEPSWEM